MQSTDNHILTFCIDNTLSAFATLADALGQPESWDALVYYPETLSALRQMPENFQTELGKPYIKAIFEERFAEPDELNAAMFSDYDAVIASGLRDLLEMTMQALQNHYTTEERTKRKLLKGTPSNIFT